MGRRVWFPLPIAAVMAAAIVTSFLVVSGCSNRESTFEPLRDTPSGPVVSGLVSDPAGTSIANAVVTLEPIEGGVSASVKARLRAARAKGATIEVTPGSSDPLASSVRSAVADRHGRFAFAGVSPGAYLVTGNSRDHLAGVERIVVPSATEVETTFVDIALTPTGSFYGSVTLENATNHQSTIVYVQGTSFAAVTNPAGVYTISGVPVGTWTVRATHPGFIDGSTSGSIAAAGDSIALAAMSLRLDSNIRPVASGLAPSAAFIQVPASFTGAGSDDDGTVVRYEWDFENDGVFEYTHPASAAATHEYPSAGTYTAKLRVTDNLGAIGLDAVSVSVLPAVFVSSSTGSGANPGTKALPMATISQGLSVAVSQGVANVLVATGTYAESPAFVNGKSVRGSYHPTTWLAQSGTTTIQVGTTKATADNITSATTISRLSIVASNAPPGQSSIAMSCSGGLASTLVFEDCAFQSGNGGAPLGGAVPGSGGTPGSTGGTGSNGNCDGSQGPGGLAGFSSACLGGVGGAGGAPGSNPGNPGAPGACSGGAGGGGGAAGDPGSAGNGGLVGLAGTDGAGGTATSGNGTVVGGVWLPLASGTGVSGSNGRGGGGGGGGGAQDVFIGDGGGNGGGGGGGGGTLGTAGAGGTGGYASFAVYVFDCSPTLVRCSFTSGSGGAGMNGANGGAGGTAGNGGSGAANCLGEIGRGGNGGNGGRGGHGGGGAGGPGGPSFALWRAGTSSASLVDLVSATIGNGGLGGSGGLSGGGVPASSGSAGLSGTLH